MTVKESLRNGFLMLGALIIMLLLFPLLIALAREEGKTREEETPEGWEKYEL